MTGGHASPGSIFVSALGTLKLRLQIQGYFYKATPIYEVSSNLSQIRTNFAFAAYSVNLEKTNAGIHVFYRQKYNLTTSDQWTSLFRGQTILAYLLNLELGYSVHYDKLHPLHDSGFVHAMYLYG